MGKRYFLCNRQTFSQEIIFFKSEPKKGTNLLRFRLENYNFFTFKRCLEINLVISMTWIRTGSGSVFIKFCGSGYNQSGSTSPIFRKIRVEETTKSFHSAKNEELFEVGLMYNSFHSFNNSLYMHSFHSFNNSLYMHSFNLFNNSP